MVNSIHCPGFTRYLLDRGPPPTQDAGSSRPPPGVLDLNLKVSLKGPPLLGGGLDPKIPKAFVKGWHR